MRKKNLSILGAFFLLLFFSCDQQLDHAPPAAEPAGFGDFDRADAQAYFEMNATDLAPLSFSANIGTRAQGLELIPEWDKFSESANGQVSLVEIPLWSNSVNVGTTTFTENGKIVCQKFFISLRRLVIARRSSGETDMFVVTFIPSVMAEGNPEKNMKNFHYLGGGGFTGRVFCSTLEGRFVEAWEYENGKRFPIQMIGRRILTGPDDTLAEGIRELVGFQEMVQTRTGTYSFSIELPGVDVLSCRYCYKKLEQGEKCHCRCILCGTYPCQCCIYCGQYPCTCCKVCGNRTCTCKCQVCGQNPCAKCYYCGRHYCYGACRSSGGGSGSGGDKPADKEEIIICLSCGKNPCVCCPQCKGPCKCSGCHQYPCVCCPGEKCPDCGGLYPWSVPETRSASPCPLCFCWNKNTHHEIIDSLTRISSLDAAWVEEFKKANNWCDNFFEGNQATSNAYLHAMNTVRDQSPAEAQRIFEDHLRAELNEFVNAKSVRSLGIAIHGITDSFCPSHEGFQFIRLVSAKIIEHTKWDKGKNSPEAVRAATNCASGVIGIMKEGKPDSVKRAIDYWRTSYQNNLNNRQ